MKKKEEYELLFENRNRREIIFHKMNERARSQRGQRTMERKYRVVKKWRMKGIVALATRFRRKLG